MAIDVTNKLHDVTSHKAVIFTVVAVGTSNLTKSGTFVARISVRLAELAY
jgi:hypothetical protein